jgi:sialic acid synthase SpsE/sugar phosphate isomerase/epimerase
MIIERQVERYTIRADASLQAALQAIDSNAEGFILCTDENGLLEGILTDGDARRWLIRQGQVDLTGPVAPALRRDFAYAHLGDSRERMGSLLVSPVKFLPLLDERRRLAGLARRRAGNGKIRIGGRKIGPDAPVFVMAEIGINHNGCEARARRLIDAAARAGADSAKFQMRHMDALYRQTASDAGDEDLGVQYQLGLLQRFRLDDETMRRLFDYTRERGLIPICTPWEEKSLAALEAWDMPAYKVASADLTNHPLLLALARTYKPLIVSTGMSDEDEIRQSVALLKNQGAAYVLLHCNSTYPAPFKDVNLRYLARLREIGECPTGYSGHERGIHVAVAAVAQGACMVEKHLTENRELEGSDHKVSLLPDEFAAMVEGIRQAEEALGSGGQRFMSQGEMTNRVSLAKSLVAVCALQAGEPIEERMVAVRSPGRGLQPNRRAALIGRRAARDMQPGDFFFPSDLDGPAAAPRAYRFSRPWGLTVRWHDFRTMAPLSNPDFLEFHLSFRDMEEDYLSFFDADYDLDLKVHSPDTFANDHLLDLSNPDPAHRRVSVRHLQRVIDLTRRIMPRFRRAVRPTIIASLGGFTVNAPLSPDQIAERYALMAESLAALDRDGVEIVGQTLPPFPWYFGGQLHLNLFVHAEDTARFCASQNLRLCLDICHTCLAATHFGYTLKDMVARLAPYTAHLHLADARGVDGEGLQIGEGVIDFRALAAQCRALCPEASFIPEIWQGHKNSGEGFWLALERLEALGF